MKNVLLPIFLLLSSLCIGQEIVTEPDGQSSLEKLSSFDAKNSMINVRNNYLVPEINLNETGAVNDSTIINVPTIEVTENLIRFDPVLIANKFPEVATIDASNNIIIDYDSFIPILLEMITDQQKLILDLKTRLTAIEEKIQ